MIDRDNSLSPRRAETLSLIAMVVHGLFFVLTLMLGAYAGSLAVRIEGWHYLGGVLVWFILLLQFRQRRLAEEERFDAQQAERLRKEGRGSVFEEEDSDAALRLAERRLQWLERHLLTIFAVLIAAYLLGVGYWLFRGVRSAEEVVLADREKLLVAAANLAGFALASFLFSRYAVGMSRRRTWRPLRAGGSFLLSNALVCFGLSVILVVGAGGYVRAERVASYVLVIVMMAIGVEILLNLVLDAYRPRKAGEYRRPAYESRLLGLFSEPGGLLRTAAHALDYQFGFKVSETWFYRLMERAVVPLVLVQALVLYLMTCLAIIPPGEVGVLERFGAPKNLASPWESGLHLKYPWPIDVVKTFPLERLQILEIGFEREAGVNRQPVLWTTSHWKQEYPFLVAVEKYSQRTEQKTDPPLRDPDAVSEVETVAAAATRESANAATANAATANAATANAATAGGAGTVNTGAGNGDTEVDTEVGHVDAAAIVSPELAGADSSGVTTGNARAGLDATFHEATESERDDFDMLVIALVVHYRITDVALYGYGDQYGYTDPRELLEALCAREVVRFSAQHDIQSLMGPGWTDTTEILHENMQQQADEYELGVAIDYVGLESVHPPLEVGESFEKVVAALQTKQARVFGAQGQAAETLAQARGQRATRLAEAEAYKIRRGELAQATGQRFRQQVKAYQAGKAIYLEREYLSVLDEMLPSMRKYFIGSEDVSRWVYEFDMKEKLEPDLLEGLEFGQED